MAKAPTKKAPKNVTLDLGAVDTPLEVNESKQDSSTYDKPATRWLNIDFVLTSASDPTRKKRVALPFGIILDSLEDKLAEGTAPNSKKPFSKADIAKYEACIKLLDSAFSRISAGSSMDVPVIARLSKPSSVEDDVEEVDDFTF